MIKFDGIGMTNARRVIIDQENNRTKKLMIIFWLIVFIPLTAYFSYRFFSIRQQRQEQNILPLVEQLRQATIAGTLKSQESTSGPETVEKPQTNELESQEPETSTTPSLDKTLLKIKVLNGSGFPGDAQKTAELLESKDYKNIQTGDAGSYDYKTTIIEIKKGKDDYYFLLTQDLKEKHNEFVKQGLEEKSEFDVIIVVAK